jgi:hypothetical protein
MNITLTISEFVDGWIYTSIIHEIMEISSLEFTPWAFWTLIKILFACELMYTINIVHFLLVAKASTSSERGNCNKPEWTWHFYAIYFKNDVC